MRYPTVKRIVDFCAALVALVILIPVFAAIWAAVRLSTSGPAFYRSARMGAAGQTFEMFKFRTMSVNAPDLRNADGSTYSGADDPRVTPFGRWLRRTSLDELPQLWNVVRGDMSLVGPRPDLPDQVRHYAAAEWRRLDVRPGITGLAQISGRNDLSWQERRRIDVEYVNSMSLRHDLHILARTLPRMLSGGGVFSKPSAAHEERSREN